MSDLQCPYCGADNEVCHDDGMGYAEGVRHEMECGSCGKSFVFLTSISFYYEPYKADCLNGEPHKFKATCTIPREFTTMRCEDCDAERDCTPEEMAEVMAKYAPKPV